jgi:hypothetical protein
VSHVKEELELGRVDLEEGILVYPGFLWISFTKVFIRYKPGIKKTVTIG